MYDINCPKHQLVQSLVNKLYIHSYHQNNLCNFLHHIIHNLPLSQFYILHRIHCKYYFRISCNQLDIYHIFIQFQSCNIHPSIIRKEYHLNALNIIHSSQLRKEDMSCYSLVPVHLYNLGKFPHHPLNPRFSCNYDSYKCINLSYRSLDIVNIH